MKMQKHKIILHLCQGWQTQAIWSDISCYMASKASTEYSIQIELAVLAFKI